MGAIPLLSLSMIWTLSVTLTILLTWDPAAVMQADALWLAERRQKLRQTQTVLQADFCEQGEKIISVDSITGFRKKAFICAVRYN